MSCDQKGCDLPRDLTIRLDCAHFVCPTCLPRLQTSDDEHIRCSTCARPSFLQSVVAKLENAVQPHLSSAVCRVKELREAIDKFEEEVQVCCDQAQTFAQRAVSFNIPSSEMKTIMQNVRKQFQEYEAAAQKELSWVRERANELLSSDPKHKRKTMGSESLNDFHKLLVRWTCINESPLKSDYLRMSFSVSVQETAPQRKSRTFLEWMNNPGYTCTMTTGEELAENEQKVPFEILETKQRASFLDNALKSTMPLPLTQLTGSLLPDFAGCLTKRMTSHGLCRYDASCMCDDILVAIERTGRTFQIWDTKQMRVRGVVNIPRGYGPAFSLCYLGQDTVAVGMTDGNVLFININLINDSDLQFSSTSVQIPHLHSLMMNALAPLRDGRLVSGSDDRLRVWRRTGASWHDGVVLDLTINLLLEGEPEPDDAAADLMMKLVELSDGSLLCGTTDGRIRIFNTSDGACLKYANTNDCTSCLAPLDGKRFVTAAYEGIKVWSTAHGDLQCIRTIPLEHSHEYCLKNPYCTLLAAADVGNNLLAMPASLNCINLYDLENGTVVRRLKCSASYHMEYLDGRLIAFGPSNKARNHLDSNGQFVYFEEWR